MGPTSHRGSLVNGHHQPMGASQSIGGFSVLGPLSQWGSAYRLGLQSNEAPKPIRLLCQLYPQDSGTSQTPGPQVNRGSEQIEAPKPMSTPSQWNPQVKVGPRPATGCPHAYGGPQPDEGPPFPQANSGLHPNPFDIFPQKI